MTITKEKIASMLNAKLGLSISVCEEIVSTVFLNILEIAKDQKITLRNFGRFEVVSKKARPGINFHTKLPVMINSKTIVRFTPSANLKALINEPMSDENAKFSSSQKKLK